MQVREIVVKDALDQIPDGLVAFDLEMANSFTNAPPVICMIGLETYRGPEAGCVAEIASITHRDEEPELIAWFLRRLGELADGQDEPALLTFSGTENDLPWIRQRMERFAFERAQRDALEAFRHIDLKIEFYRRTHSDQMSLKNLERIFGIDRESPISSRKVSFILTDVLRGRRRERAIPEKIYQYLHQDVHHLLQIYDRWAEVSLEAYRLTDQDYLAQLNSLRNSARRCAESSLTRRHDARRLIKSLQRFQRELEQNIDRALVEETFVDFTLPDLPAWSIEHPELARLAKKYDRVAAITVRDEATGAYLLRSKPSRPKGALAVVIHEGRLLMIRRADELKRAAGYWGLPGGSLENGESPERGAERELIEEVGLQGRARKLLGTSTSLNGEYTLYWVELEVPDISTLRRREVEVADIRWVTPKEVARLEPLIPGALEGFRRFLGPEWG